LILFLVFLAEDIELAEVSSLVLGNDEYLDSRFPVLMSSIVNVAWRVKNLLAV